MFYFNVDDIQEQSLGCTRRKGLLQNISQSSKEYIIVGVFLYQVVGLDLRTLTKSRIWYWFFVVSFAKFLGTTYIDKL